MLRFLPMLLLFAVCTGCVGASAGGHRGALNMILPLGCMTLEDTAAPSPAEPSGGAGVYFRDRGNDFVDIFSLSLSLGLGIQANVRATQAIQAGGLFFGGTRFGFIGREGGGWSETVTEMGIPGFYIRSVEIMHGSGNISPLKTERGQSIWQFLGDTGVPYDEGYDRKFWQVGATVHAGLIGVDFSLNLKELLDFFLGWVAIDISRDDTANRPPKAGDAAKPPNTDLP